MQPSNRHPGGRLRRHDRAVRGPRRRDRGGARPALHGRHRHPGLAVAGDRAGRNANSTWLNGRPFDRDLAAALDRPVRFANDANCFALSEAIDGAAAGPSPVFGVILGTGVGGGIVIDRRLVTGANAIAGEWGHSPLPWPADAERPGPPCYCGKAAAASRPSCPARDWRSTIAGRPARPLDAATIAARADAGDAAAAASLARYEDRLARGLATVINLLDPAAIVLGGGLGRIGAALPARAAALGRLCLFRQRRDPAAAAAPRRRQRRARRRVALGPGRAP